MTDLVASGLLGDPDVDTPDFQDYIEALRDFLAESRGGDAPGALTIASGAIVPPAGSGGGTFTVDTEGLIASDTLSSCTLTNVPEGRTIRISANNASRVVTIEHGAGVSGEWLLEDAADFVLDATDKWVEFQRISTTMVEQARGYGVDKVAERAYLGVPKALGSVLCPHEDLRIDYVTAATATVTADAVLLTDADGNQRVFTGLNETFNVGTTGANGRDISENSGAEKASDWYHIWAIGKDDGTLDVFGLLACFPGGTDIFSQILSGYTFAGYLGALYNDGSSNLNEVHQMGDLAFRTLLQVLGSGTATSRTSVSLAAAVPDTAREVALRVDLRGESTNAPASGTIYPSMSASSSTGLGFSFSYTGTTSLSNIQNCNVPLHAAQTIGYSVGSGPDEMTLIVTGWRY